MASAPEEPADVLIAAALALHRQQRHADALQACRRLLTSAPDHLGAHRLLGATECELGGIAPGAARLARAVQLGPAGAEGLADLAGALLGLGRVKEAGVRFRQALAL